MIFAVSRLFSVFLFVGFPLSAAVAILHLRKLRKLKGELANLRANPASAEKEQAAATSLIAERVEALLGIVNEIGLAQIEINCKSMSADNDAEQTSARVATVADATKELHVSILEIANQINRNAQVVSEATFKAKDADVIIQTMLVAVDRICEILAVIKAVALRV